MIKNVKNQKKHKNVRLKPPPFRTKNASCGMNEYVGMNMEEKTFEERAALCALNRIFGFEPKVGAGLVDAVGCALDVFGSPKEAAEILGGRFRSRYAHLISESAFESAAMELEGLEADGCRFVGIGEKGYPALLMECDDPPLGLYYKGQSNPLEVFDGLPQVAVVGTRGVTSYGRDLCRRIVEVMSRSSVKPLVVSGLALGVDAAAHRAALESGLPTVAVMATGIDKLYPSANRDVGEAIASTPGCALVTDYPPGTDAVRINFLRRNRIIAGICRATILVESRIKGGGMMTARLASSYGRDVYALPGRIDDPLSQGCNLLIRENLAEQIGDLAELVGKLGLGKPRMSLKADFKAAVEGYYKGRLPEVDCSDILKVASLVKTRRGVSVDELSSSLGWTYSRVSRLVTALECDGFISVDLLQHCVAKTRTPSPGAGDGVYSV